MSIVEQFIVRWHQLERAAGDSRVALPTRTATAAADILPGVGGAAICVYDSDGARLAVGVSGPQALLAEQLEYTIGDGPGLDAQHAASPVVIAGHHFGRRWPVFHDVLLTHTAFRAALAVPLAGAATDWFAVLMLYYRRVDHLNNVGIADLADISEVADVIAFTVMCAMTELTERIWRPNGAGLPHHIEQRLAVSVATGMLVGSQHLIAADALAVLRGHAYTHNQTLDHSAFQVVTGQLDSSTL